MNPLRAVGMYFFRERLENTGPAATFARLCTSRHLEDLQWIACIVVLLTVIMLPLDLATSHFTVLDAKLPVASVLVAGVTAILSWIYQTGSSRIGAVDLFACEISAICRVSVVAQFAQGSVEQARASVDARDKIAGRFTSEEH
jgi:hypothetical protein